MVSLVLYRSLSPPWVFAATTLVSRWLAVERRTQPLRSYALCPSTKEKEDESSDSFDTTGKRSKSDKKGAIGSTRWRRRWWWRCVLMILAYTTRTYHWYCLKDATPCGVGRVLVMPQSWMTTNYKRLHRRTPQHFWNSWLNDATTLLAVNSCVGVRGYAFVQVRATRHDGGDEALGMQ